MTICVTRALCHCMRAGTPMLSEGNRRTLRASLLLGTGVLHRPVCAAIWNCSVKESSLGAAGEREIRGHREPGRHGVTRESVLFISTIPLSPIITVGVEIDVLICRIGR